MSWIVLAIVLVLIVPLIYTLFSAPFVPTSKSRVNTMIRLANLNKKKRVYELGCGDSRVIRAAAKKGVKEAVGFDLSIPLVLYGKLLTFLQKNPAQIHFGNIWSQDYSNTDVIFCYLLPFVMPRVQKEIWLQLKPGARIVSNAFPMEGIEEDVKENGVYLYIKK